ncbi:reticulon-like protein B8 isoform X2 [Cucurbita moschata]|nr:reticulon-like protein B8 isoform X2 [Cucurbita moschata]XP_022931541.1 reticulon-like protein B8 isoform X2 [Cucurbita moschata]XP_022931542.1 reticulon-like protein B8 isoform X2 [Cucurbita moschata]XP_022931543.1 reticulon-like protein B8 isoform X2 [Cucurbita moschata]
MSENVPAKDLPQNFSEAPAERGHKAESVSSPCSVAGRKKRIFGRKKSIHHLLGGGKCADVLLWKNKKISASVLTGATIIWILFEWLSYHFLTIVCFALVLGMLFQFIWTNASGFLDRTSSNVPHLDLPVELFVEIAVSFAVEANRALHFLQDIACNGDLKQFLGAVVSLWAGAVISSWSNFITVLYVGFVAAHTVPILYEKYEDEVDTFAFNVFDQLCGHFQKLDSSVFSKIPRGGPLPEKKHE